MISSADDDHSLPDPSSSDKKKLLHDFKFNTDDIDLFNQHHSFSIRGYVSDSRSKDIASNWPFSDKTLEICLQNGVKSVLPPFQSLESLRNNSSNEEIISNSVGKTAIVDEFKSNQELTLTQIKSKKSSLVSSTKTEIKKCRIKLKLNTSVEPIKEVTPMASKVCPVCKTFSSSSNTTLNAHIDQCLSGESSMKWTANPKLTVKQHSTKPRIKPRKMRTMVDIYKTAPHCTVEELDARNGTSWANNSNTAVVVPEVADHEGAVYIDTNGTKVRILSVPKVDTSEGHGVRKLMKRGKLSKSVIGKKKSKNRNQSKNLHKSLKQIPNSKKSSTQVKAGQKENVAIGKNCNKEDRGKQPMMPEGGIYKDDTPIVRPPWACSKRTVLARKLRENIHSPHNVTKNFSPTASDESFSESDLRIPSSSSHKSEIPSPKGSQRMRTSPGQYAKKKSPTLTTPSSKKKELKHSKGSNCSKFLSSLSVNKEPAIKINLKRKFSALEKTCTGPSQGSLKQQSVVEEDKIGKTSSESMNHLEVSKNKETKVFRPENSVASRSSNGDPSYDVESVSKESQSQKEQVSTMQVSKELGVDMFDSQECYKDKETYSADFIQKSVRTDDVTEDRERKHKYFQVDPIQLPEPRGSFFSSLGGDMVSEEFHANSSVIDRDSMSDSPISTISNPSLARSDSDKFSVRSSTSLKDDATRDIIDAINEKYATSSGDWRSMHATSLKNDYQPCCCSRKEGVSSQIAASSYQESTLLRKNAIESFNFKPQMFSDGRSSQPPPIPPPPPVAENVAYPHTSTSPSKPVLRLMGKNLTVVKTDEDLPSPQQFGAPHPQVSPMGRFPSVQNEYIFSTLGYHHPPYQNGYQPPNNMTSHALETMFRSTSYADYESPHVGPMISEARTMHKPPSNPMKDIIVIDDSPADETRNWTSSQYSTHNHNHNHMPYGYESQGSQAFSNGGFQGYSPFMNVEDTRTHDKWNCTPAGSSRSSSIYHPSGF
ncbi:hypothetical protein CTI12_AA450810 [Artemisia annua]|uniref:Hapless 8 n=1 Tax=Artemisia annua TaxID=35608 RepID=A0A2U1LV35_ARTAN|nr:hypothetical protein CTI12_AA450810 [Artemisia annua]